MRPAAVSSRCLLGVDLLMEMFLMCTRIALEIKRKATKTLANRNSAVLTLVLWQSPFRILDNYCETIRSGGGGGRGLIK